MLVPLTFCVVRAPGINNGRFQLYHTGVFLPVVLDNSACFCRNALGVRTFHV